MSYPTMNGVVRVQVQMNGDSGLPEDVFVNTWYFLEQAQTLAWEDASLQQDVWDLLDGYYGTAQGAATASIASFISPRVDSVTYSMAPLYVDPPRYPIAEVAGSWSGAATTPLPEEVAIVSTFYGNETLSPGVNTPRARRRGRHYLGPFTTGALTTGSTVGRPNGNLLTSIKEAGAWALTQQDPSRVQWVVVSPTQAADVSVLSAISPVDGGWVDNAWDTQRSRGIASNARQTFGVPIT